MGSRHRNSRRGPQGTGYPDPAKDRSVHEAARGKKMETLQDLTRRLPSEEEFEFYLELIAQESDRGGAVMAGALVERALEDRLREFLHDPGDGTPDTWFEGVNAPFRSFFAKITLAVALRLVDSHMETCLTAIKNIRNTFAHSMAPLSFSHPAIAAECVKLRATDGSSDNQAPRTMYAISCLAVARILGKTQLVGKRLESARIQSVIQDALRATAKVSEPKVEDS